VFEETLSFEVGLVNATGSASVRDRDSGEAAGEMDELRATARRSRASDLAESGDRALRQVRRRYRREGAEEPRGPRIPPGMAEPDPGGPRRGRNAWEPAGRHMRAAGAREQLDAGSCELPAASPTAILVMPTSPRDDRPGLAISRPVDVHPSREEMRAARCRAARAVASPEGVRGDVGFTARSRDAARRRRRAGGPRAGILTMTGEMGFLAAAAVADAAIRRARAESAVFPLRERGAGEMGAADGR
jgi:hypothetical protein